MALRVFLVDDHELVRAGLRNMLEADIEVVGEAANVTEAIARGTALGSEVAVLDVRLPDGDDIEVCHELRSRLPHVQCLMLTSFADYEALFAAIKAGASGYVLMQIRGSDMLTAVRQMGRGESLIDPSITKRVFERLREGPARDERLDRLSNQERRVLDLVAEGLRTVRLPTASTWRRRRLRTTSRARPPSWAWAGGARPRPMQQDCRNASARDRQPAARTGAASAPSLVFRTATA